MAFVREEKKKAGGVEVSQAPARLHNHLASITAHMKLRIRSTHDPYDRIVLVRDIALFTVAFSTMKRGDKLSRTLIQRICLDVGAWLKVNTRALGRGALYKVDSIPLSLTSEYTGRARRKLFTRSV